MKLAGKITVAALFALAPIAPVSADAIQGGLDGSPLAVTPGTRFRDCDACPEMMVLPAGSFQMGSATADAEPDEAPTRTITFRKPFAVGVFEISFENWQACVGAGGCNGYVPEDASGNSPVVNVSRKDARHYIAWLSRTTGARYRLPSEAEWEYAASGQTPELNAMIGSVWEIMEDCYHRDGHKGAPKNGRARAACNTRGIVLKGGSWRSPPESLRITNRSATVPSRRRDNVGFRVVRDMD